VGRRRRKKKTDYGTVILHWLLAGSVTVAVATGLRIATEAPNRSWIALLDPILPKAAVWTEHLQSAVLLIAVAVAYAVYVWRLGLGQRVRFDKIRLRGLFGRPYARWGSINIILYWLFIPVVLSQIVTGALLYFGDANSVMVQMHWLGMWIILGYVPLHLYSQWHFGGAAQLLRILRPTRLAAASPQFELADLLALLDQQASPGLVPHQPNLAGAFAAGSRPAQRSVAFGNEQALHRSPLVAGNTVTTPRASPPAYGPTNARKWPAARHLNASIMACVAASLVVVVMLTAERHLITTLYIYRVDAADIPTIDGETSDPIWQKIPPLHVLTENGGNFDGTGETTVSIRAVHDGVRAYFLFIWDDPTRSLKQLPLMKSAGAWQLLHKGYEVGDEHAYNEDKFSVLFTTLDTILAGDTTFHAGAAPLADEPATLSGRGLHYTTRDGLIGDVWEWKATSTNASGYCDDDYFGAPVKATPAQFQGLTPYRGGFAPDPGAANYQNNFTLIDPGNYAQGVVPRRLPQTLEAMNDALGRVDLDPDHGESEAARWYMTDEESAPYSPQRDQLIPDGTIVPGVVISGKYSGDRADVRCVGRWAAGRWALEVTRRLDTGSNYDVPIRTGTFMRVAAFDHAQIRHTRHVRPIRLEVQ
jgi:hypothetical protein